MPRRHSPAVALLLVTALLLTACVTTPAPPESQKKATALRNLGEAYLGEGNFTAALGEFLKALELNPDDPILHNDLGLAYMARERYDLATLHFEKAVQLKPDYSLAKNNLGSAYMVQKRWDQAIPVLESVTGDMLYATPQFPLANLGWAYYNKGDYRKAETYLKEALKLQPDFFIAQLNLGRTHLAAGRLNLALNLFEQAAETQPKDPGLLLELGRTYRLLGDSANARLALNGAIANTEDAELALEASEELKKIR